MSVSVSTTNKPLNPRAQDLSPKGYNRAALYSGKALDFDGVNDTLKGAEPFSYTTHGISAYFNTSSASSYKIVFDGRDGGTDGPLITIEPGNRLKYQINGVSTTEYIVTADEWYHIVGVYDGTNQSIYINGNLWETITNSGSISVTTNWSVGVRSFSSEAAWFDGMIGGVKAFSTALTAAQVSDLYLNPEKIVPDGVADSALKLWLPMMEGAGTTAYDGSGNGNHGTISGATWVSGIGAPVAQTALVSWNKSHNYIYKSEEFETASWTENQLITITDDSFIAPDGSATATEIVETTANDSHFLAQTLSVTAGDYFISAYVKKRDYDWIQLSTGGDTSRYANFNISTGTTGNASDISDLVIQDKGNGWYRIGGKITTSATSFNYFIALIQSDVASRFQTYTGTDKGQYIWGAQATKSSTLQPYLRNIGTSAITSPVLLPQGLTANKDITGVNAFESARNPYALNLDGASWGEVHDNASVDITNAITLEAWINSTDKDQYHHIISKNKSADANYAIITEVTTGYLGFEIVGGEFKKTDYNVMDGNWNHVVATYDETNLKFYVNGALDETIAYTSAIPTNSVDVYIGARPEGLQLYEADIALPRIYNRALTATEVARNYNADRSKFGL